MAKTKNMAKKKTNQHHEHAHEWNITSTVAKTDDGGVQITFTIPTPIINEEKEHALEALAPGVTVQGFRKGKAPIDKVKAQISQEKLLQKALEHILPHAFSDAVVTNQLKPAIYPRFEIITTGDETWQVRAETCEVPQIELGDYKAIAAGALRSASLVKSSSEKQEELTIEQKQQKVIESLIDSIKFEIPKMLIEEEVNARLGQLLERIEKLGLNLDSYLASVGKNPEGLRAEYEEQTKQAIALELILNKIAEVEKITISEKEIEEAMQASDNQNPNQKQFIASVLRRRAVLDQLIKIN